MDADSRAKHTPAELVDALQDRIHKELPGTRAATADSPDLAWIRERLDYANRAAYDRMVKRGNELAEAVLRDVRKLDVLTVLCPLCGEAVLNDGTFEACADCPEGE